MSADNYPPVWVLMIMNHNDRNLYLQQNFGRKRIQNSSDVRNVGELLTWVSTECPQL